jgi:hypothetical protein
MRTRFWKLTIPQLAKKFPASYRSWHVITYFFITFCNLALPWSGLVQSTSCCHISLSFVLTVSYPLYWGLTGCLFNQVLLIIPRVWISLFLRTYVPRVLPTTLLLTWSTGERHSPWSVSLRSFPHSPLTSFVLGPSIFVSTLFSNTLSLCSSIYVVNQVSNSHKTIGKIRFSIFYVILYLVFCPNTFSSAA